MTRSSKGNVSPSRWIVLCTACRQELGRAASEKDARFIAFKHAVHTNDDVLLVDQEAKPNGIDVQTRAGFPTHRRVRGEAAGGSFVAKALAPKPYLARPFAVVCTACQELLFEASADEDAFALAQGHTEHGTEAVIVIDRLCVEPGEMFARTASGRLKGVRQRVGEPEGGPWQGLLEAAQERKTA